MSNEEYKEEWKQIDSAPKDGRRILLCNGSEVVVGSWQISPLRGPEWWSHQTNGTCYPTHWMNLPEAPGKDQMEALALELADSREKMGDYIDEMNEMTDDIRRMGYFLDEIRKAVKERRFEDAVEIAYNEELPDLMYNWETKW